MKILRLYPVVFGCLIAFATTSCKKQSSVDMPPSAVSIYQIITEDSYNFSYFKYLVDKAGQAGLLQSGNYTVFVPSNNAFVAAGYTMAVMDLMSADSLVMMLKNHVVEGKLDILSLSSGQELTALSGDKIVVHKIGNDVYVDGGNVTNPNKNATNGNVQVINKLLVKRTSIMDRLYNYGATGKSQFTFLTAALERASQGSTNFISMFSDPAADYTLFAPNDGAFMDGGYSSLGSIAAAEPDTLGEILKRHILTGRQLVPDLDSSKPKTSLSGNIIYFDRLKPANTTYSYANGIGFSGGSADMLGGSRGVIHSVSRFIPVPINMTTLARIQADTSLTFFLAALEKASEAGDMDFVALLSDPESSYTVFAVTNDGFRNAGYADANAVSSENASVLSEMIKFHILSKRINNINVAENGTVATLLGVMDTDPPSFAALTFTFTGGFKVKGLSNKSTIPVITANIVTKNGLLNTIGQILTP